jgi:transposase InsO family protein
VVASEDASDSVRLWHQRLGHMSEKGLKVLVDRKSLPSLKFLNLNFCKYCVFGKQCRQKFKVGRHISKGILDYIHSDVWGPSPTVSFGGSSYYVTFIDDYSRKVWVYLLKRKDDVFITFKQFRALVEKSTDRSIKCLRTDNGGEFTSMEFENYCKEDGIERHKTTVYTPQQNGVVERMNRTLLERARSMLSNAKMQ